MPSNLTRFFSGEPDPARRKLTAAELRIRNQVRSAAIQADGALRFGEHVMDGLVELDVHRRMLARDDPTLNVLLAEVEAETVGQVKKIQRNLYSQWELP
ncbi:MAG: hypothetical protein QOK43_1976 [Acidimicrobiaceae bacterium]|nr:hypothetical protein [Acidimicrobiaceae bacterium]